jgi:VCBS repeat-containing protein
VLANDDDPDNNTLSAQLYSGPAHGMLALNTDGSFVYTPFAGYSGADSFRYVASDGSLDSTPATVSLNVIHVNHAPSAAADSAAVVENAAVAADAGSGLLANDADADRDQLTVSSVQYGDTVIAVAPNAIARIDTDYGTLLVGSDGAFSYTANGASSVTLDEGAVTGDAFTYTISDGVGGTSTAQLAIAITGVNDAPVITGPVAAQAVSDKGSLQPFGGVTIADADSPAQQLTVRVTLDNPTRGSLAGAAGIYDAASGIYTFTGTAADATTAVRALVFTPTENRATPGQTESTRLTVSVNDGLASASDTVVTVTTTSVNDAPACSRSAA